MANYHYLNYEKVFEFCKNYFMSIGVSEEGSATIADVLTTSRPDGYDPMVMRV